jgi:hypothetical protein
MTSRTRYFVILSLSVMGVGVSSGLVAYYVGFPARAFSSQGPEELQYVPRDAAVLAYADVREIMASDLRQRLRRAQPGPQDGQQEFQNQTGINIETDIQHVVAYLKPNPDPSANNVPNTGMVLARGLFDEVKIEALMREHGATVEQYQGKRLIVATPKISTSDADANTTDPLRRKTPPELALSFLKPGLVAVGSAALIRQAIDLEKGGENVTSNTDVMNLVKSFDSGNAWAVGRFDAIQSAAKLPLALNQLPAITWFSVTAQINDAISGVLRAEARDEESAKNLRDVLNGFLALARLQAGSKPEFQALTQSLQPGGTGKTVALSFSVPGAIFDLIPPAGPFQKKQPAH